MGAGASVSEISSQYVDNLLTKEELIESLLPYYMKDSKRFDEAYLILRDRARNQSKSTSLLTGPAEDIIQPRGYTEEIVDAINLVRLTPKQFIPILEKHLESFIDDLHYTEKNDSNIRIRTREGKTAVLECISYLQTVQPIRAITNSKLLEQSSLDHVKDLSENDKLSHISSDGTSIQHRIERYGTWRGFIGENIDCGNKSPLDIIMMLLIDDGDISRGHRENCFNPNFLEVGAAISSHPSYQYCCVMDFATKVLAWNEVQTTAITVESNQKKSLTDQSEDFQRVVRSIPMDNVINQISEMIEGTDDNHVTIDFHPEKSSAVISCKTGKTIRKLNVTWESK